MVLAGRLNDAGRAGHRPRFPSGKFARPETGPRLVPRPQVGAMVDLGRQRALTLVVGAPGTGKTSALAGWLERRARDTVAWLTCDSGDRSPERFVAALIEAMVRGFGVEDLGASARQLLDSDGVVSIDVLAALGDDLEDLGGQRVLVLDDFHLVQGPSVDAFGDFLDCTPSSLQVVVASRSEPAMRLQRMRVHQELVEITDADLAFSVDETRDVLHAFGLDLAEPDVVVVHERMEGWPAGIQMAAICIDAAPAPSAGLPDVRGDTIAGYFLEEVLGRQPEELVDFMLSTSILDELSPSACVALCGARGTELLAELCASHLFVTPVDASRKRYRYHRLVQEVLADELRGRDPQRERALHRAASKHFVEDAHAGLAARHLLQAGAAAEAFGLLGRHMPRDVLTQPTMASALDLDDFRPELFAGSPAILVPLAAELLWRGPFESGVRAVRLAQECVIEPEEQPQLALHMAAVNAVFHALVGEWDLALHQRDLARALTVMSGGEGPDWMVAVDTTAVWCLIAVRDLDGARRLVRELATKAMSVAHVDVLCAGLLSQAALIEGDLDEAASSAERSLDAAQRLDFDRHFFVVPALLTSSQVALERRDLTEASDLVERMLTIVRSGRPMYTYLAQLQRARIWAASGDLESALASLSSARASLRSTTAIALADADELEAQLRLRLGDHFGARGLVGRLGTDRWAIRTIVALATGEHDRAEVELRSAPASPMLPRDGIVLQLLRAEAALASGRPGAERDVRRALDAAHQRGFLQTVLDTTPRLVEHLATEPDRYVGTEQLVDYVIAWRDSGGGRRERTVPVDPLTDAELRVLRLLAEHMSYADIAAELFVSTNTVKTHLRHVYVKLGVSSRSSAIARASALGVL